MESIRRIYVTFLRDHYMDEQDVVREVTSRDPNDLRRIPSQTYGFVFHEIYSHNCEAGGVVREFKTDPCNLSPRYLFAPGATACTIEEVKLDPTEHGNRFEELKQKLEELKKAGCRRVMNYGKHGFERLQDNEEVIPAPPKSSYQLFGCTG